MGREDGCGVRELRTNWNPYEFLIASKFRVLMVRVLFMRR